VNVTLLVAASAGAVAAVATHGSASVAAGLHGVIFRLSCFCFFPD